MESTSLRETLGRIRLTPALGGGAPHSHESCSLPSKKPVSRRSTPSFWRYAYPGPYRAPFTPFSGTRGNNSGKRGNNPGKSLFLRRSREVIFSHILLAERWVKRVLVHDRGSGSDRWGLVAVFRGERVLRRRIR